MPNRNYVAGRKFEYETKKYHELLGYTVLRTAGSHGLFDLIALGKNKPVLLIQCKKVRTVKQADKLLSKWRKHPPLGGEYPVHQHLAVKVKGQPGYMGVIV